MAGLFDDVLGESAKTSGLFDDVLAPTEQPKEAGLISGIGQSLSQGWDSAVRSGKAAYSNVAGDLSGVEGLREQNVAAQKGRTIEAQRFSGRYDELNKQKLAEDGDLSVLDAIGSGFRAVWDQPTGFVHAGAEQTANMVAPMAGMIGGGAVGGAIGTAILPGVGTIAGTFIGRWLGGSAGNAVLEIGGKAMEKAEGGLTAAESSEATSEGAIKGGVIGAVDAATMGLSGALMRKLGKPAIEAGAMAEAKVLMNAGVDVTQPAQIIKALQDPTLRAAAQAAGKDAAKVATTAGQKIAMAGTGLGLETTSEGVGEYFGELAATGKGNVADAVLESMMGMGQASIETAYTYNKIGGNELSVKGILGAGNSEEALAHFQALMDSKIDQLPTEDADLRFLGDSVDAVTNLQDRLDQSLSSGPRDGLDRTNPMPPMNLGTGMINADMTVMPSATTPIDEAYRQAEGALRNQLTDQFNQSDANVAFAEQGAQDADARTESIERAGQSTEPNAMQLALQQAQERKRVVDGEPVSSKTDEQLQERLDTATGSTRNSILAELQERQQEMAQAAPQEAQQPAAGAGRIVAREFSGKNGQTYTLEMNVEEGEVKAFGSDGAEVGSALIAPLRGYELRADIPTQTADMGVETAHRRAGINTAMHRLISEYYPKHNWKSNLLTPDGLAWYKGATAKVDAGNTASAPAGNSPEKIPYQKRTPEPQTLISAIKQHGGIRMKSLQAMFGTRGRDYNAIKGQLGRRGGTDVSDMARIMQESGQLIVPPGQDAAQYLEELIYEAAAGNKVYADPEGELAYVREQEIIARAEAEGIKTRRRNIPDIEADLQRVYAERDGRDGARAAELSEDENVARTSEGTDEAVAGRAEVGAGQRPESGGTEEGAGGGESSASPRAETRKLEDYPEGTRPGDDNIPFRTSVADEIEAIEGDRPAETKQPDAPVARDGSVERTIQSAVAERAGSVPGISVVTGKAQMSGAGKLKAPAARAIQAIARVFKQKVVLFQADRKTVDGFVLDGVVYLNVDAAGPLSLLGHELTHRLKQEMPEAYAAVVKVMLKRMDRVKLVAMYRYYENDTATADEAIVAKLNEGNSAELMFDEMISDFGGNQFITESFWSDVFGQVAAAHPEGVAKKLITRLRMAVMQMVGAFRKAVGDKGFGATWLAGEQKSDEVVQWIGDVETAFKSAYAQWINTINTVGYEQAKRGPQSYMAAAESKVYTVNESDRHTGDLFGLSHEISQNDRKNLDRARQAATGNDGVKAESIALRSAPDAAGTYTVTTQLVSVGERELPKGVIATNEDAAEAFAYLTRGAVERLDALVTDAAGRPLAIVGSYKGNNTQASVYPGVVLQEAIRVGGAANIWLAHNHPSGVSNLSGADRNLSKAFQDLFSDVGITYRGLFAVAGRSGGETQWEHSDYSNGTVRNDVATTVKVPIVERELLDTGVRMGTLTSPSAAREIIERLAGPTPGLILLDGQSRATAFIPVANEYDTAEITRAVSKANAAAAIAANPNGAYSSAGMQNLKKFLGTMDVRLLDVFEYTPGERIGPSYTERGLFSPERGSLDLFDLVGQTNAEINADKKKQAGADKAKADEQERLRKKELADGMRGEFELTGSDRPADAAGQGSLFSPTRVEGHERVEGAPFSPSRSEDEGIANLREKPDNSSRATAPRKTAPSGAVSVFSEARILKQAEGKTITRQATIAETGETVQLKNQDAAAAIKQLRSDIEALDALRICAGA